MIDCRRQVMEIAGPCDLSVKNIQAGAPVTLGVNGYRLAVAGDPVAGLSKNYYMPGRDDVNGGEWFANSKLLGVVKIDECVLGPDIFGNPDGTLQKVFPYDNTLTYAINDVLYVDANGKLTNVAPTDPTPLLEVGIVTKPISANDPIMIINVNKN